MQAWDAVQTTLNWVEENLAKPIDVDELAATAHLSKFYYQRLFSRLVGKPVMEYVKLRRLAHAADRLATAKDQTRISEVAIENGFENHETFTRAFKCAYGLTPEEFRAEPRPLSHYRVPDLSLQYYLVDENVPLAADGIILEVSRRSLPAPRHFTGFVVETPIANTPGIDTLAELWARFHDQKERIKDPLPDGNTAGAAYPGKTKGHFAYFAGAEVKGDTAQPGFDNWTLPNGDYVVCSFEAENFHQLTTDALQKAQGYMFNVWLPKHQLNSEPFMAELYTETSPEAATMEIWIKLMQG